MKIRGRLSPFLIAISGWQKDGAVELLECALDDVSESPPDYYLPTVGVSFHLHRAEDIALAESIGHTRMLEAMAIAKAIADSFAKGRCEDAPPVVYTVQELLDLLKGAVPTLLLQLERKT